MHHLKHITYFLVMQSHIFKKKRKKKIKSFEDHILPGEGKLIVLDFQREIKVK